MSFEIPTRGWELSNETESGVQLLLKYGDRRGETIAIDRVLFPSKLRRFSRKQHASTFFQMERRKRRYEGTRWEGFTEGERQIGERVYPTMSFRVTHRNVGMTQDGLFLLYFPEDFTEKQRFFSFMWMDTHPTDAEGRGLAEFDAFVSGLRIRALAPGQPQDAGQITESQKSVSPLIRAVEAGRLETVQDLLAQGADPNAKPSALMLAANKKHIKIGSSPESVISFPRAAAAWRSSDRWRPRSARRCGSRRRDD